MNRIKELRKKKGFTARGLARRIGVSQSMLTRYENYDTNITDNSVWEKLTAIFAVSQSHLMGIAVDFPSEEEKLTKEMIMEMSRQPVNIKLNSRLEVEIVKVLFILGEVDKKRMLKDMREIAVKRECERWEVE
jgi:Predicted transcriptional regulators